MKTINKINKFKMSIIAIGGMFAMLGVSNVYAQKLPEAPSIKGFFDSAVPGANPFLFCMMPRPPRGSGLRAVYDRTCGHGKTSMSQVINQNGLTEHSDAANELSKQLAASGMGLVAGASLSSAASNVMGSSGQGNNISASQYNQRLYQQMVEEDRARELEALEMERLGIYNYVSKVPNSQNFGGSQAMGAHSQQLGELQKLKQAAANDAIILKQLQNSGPITQDSVAPNIVYKSTIPNNITKQNAITSSSFK